MIQLSQNDPRWANLPLGTSPYKIGGSGCTVTTLAMYIGTTPDIVVKRMLAVGGFTPDGLVIWAKVKEAFPGVYIEEPYIRVYDNLAVLQNIPCMVEVDFDGSDRTDDRHWVLFTGNHQMYDPLDGRVKPTSTYPVRTYRAIKGVWKQEQGTYFIDGEYKIDYTNIESMRVCFNAWVRLQKGEVVDKAQFENQLSATTQCQTQLSTALKQNETLQNEKTELQRKYDENERTVIALKKEIAEIHNQDADFGQEALDAQHLAKDRGDYINAIADEINVTYDPTDEKRVVEEVLEEIAGFKSYQPKLATPLDLPIQIKDTIMTKIRRIFFQ